MAVDESNLREEVLRRWAKLKNEREDFVPQWLEISRHITPASGRFLESRNRNNARGRWNRIYDNTATRAANILAAGLMSGMTDPSSQWFALTTGDENLDQSYAVKQYLDQVQRILEMAFTRTNTYQSLHHGWKEVGVYGTEAIFIAEDARYGFHCYPMRCGEYCIATNFRGEVDTIYRKFWMTASQLVGQFGRSVCPQAVRDAAATEPDKEFKVIHAVEPRRDRDPGRRDNLNMPYRSIMLLVDSGEGGNAGILEETGYNEFPAVVGRWGATFTDTYSEEAPGMIAIGDTLQLQHEQLQKGNAIDLQVDPPLILPTSAKTAEVDFLPGGRSYIDNPSAGSQVQSAFAPQLQLQYLVDDMEKVQRRINQAFSVDMFLMLAERTGNMTATEVAERHSEKLMMLGPVLSRLNTDVLRNFIDRTFNILQRAGALPIPPEELAGRPLSVEYTSMLARSQRAVRASSLDNFLQRVGNVAQFDPSVIKKINSMNVVDEYADYYSVAPSCIRPTEEAMAALAQEQQMQAEQAQQEQAMQQAQMAAQLAKVPAAGPENMAGQVVQGIRQQAEQQGFGGL
ncbi:MAG: head-tail connector protein [Duodenibacillus sp.]|nr:head-tail connector protein [Duodenibacillus sp.]